MSSDGCPPAEQLAGFIDGTLSPDALVVMEHHLARCDECCAIAVAVADRGEPTVTPDDGLAEPRADEYRLGRYVLLERVGAGGMGVVWSAYDPELDRRVALKMLRGDGRTQPLVREARAMARVTHPNVVTVHDVLEADARVFMVMELATGRTASAWLKESPRTWREIVALFVAAGRGLAAAHEQGVVHRDFKPDNVLVDTDARGLHRVRVSDFGLASMQRSMAAEPTGRTDIDPLDTLTARTAGFVGTPAYMAPEQYADEPADARTDQFAFCVSLWEALFGARPFAGATVNELAAAVVEGTITAPAQRKGVSLRIERALRRGLAKERGDRYADMIPLLAELERALGRRRAFEWVAIAAVPALVLVLAFVRLQDAPCSSTPAWLAEAWDRERADALLRTAGARSEAALDLARRLDTALEDRAAELSRSFDTSCRAAFVEHSIPASEHDVGLACLRQGSASIEAIAAFVHDADEPALARALAAALGPPPTCDETAEVSDRAALLAAQVRRATTFRELGDYASARENLVEPLAAATEPGLAAIAAAALYQQMLIEQRERGGAADGMERVLELAARSDNDELVFQALNQLVFQAGVKHGDTAAAEAYADLALAFAGATERGDEARGSVMLSLAQGHERAGDVTASRKALDQAHAHFVAAGSADAPRRLPMMLLRGVLDEHAGDLAAAADHYEHARRVVEDAFGPAHPDLAVALEYVAIARRKQGQLDASLAAATRSLQIRRAVLGARHHETVMSMFGLAEILIDARRWPEAEAAATEALAAVRASSGQPRFEALLLAHLATAVNGRGDADAATTLAREAVGLMERAVGADDPDVAMPLLRAAEIDLGRGAPAEAVPQLERALTMAQRDQDRLTRARIELALAQALIASGGDARRARELAANARTDAGAVAQFGMSPGLVAAADAIAK